MNATCLGLALVSLILNAGCKPNMEATPRFNAIDGSALIRDEPIVFQSWSGNWQGTDIDTELTINPDGTAKLSYFGYAHEQAIGTWAVGGDELTLKIPFSTLTQMPGAADWPTLQTTTAHGKLYLTPTRETGALQYSHGSAWPLGEVERDEP